MKMSNMKTYISPSIHVINVQSVSMLAQSGTSSLGLFDDEIDDRQSLKGGRGRSWDDED